MQPNPASRSNSASGASAPSRSRTASSGSLSGSPLDAGRLAAARANYEQRVHPQRAASALAAASTNSAAAAGGRALAASSAASAPVSRRVSLDSSKRKRTKDEDEEEEEAGDAKSDDEDEPHAAAAGSKRRRTNAAAANSTTLDTPGALSHAESLPPLETAAGVPVEPAAAASSSAAAASSAAAPFLSQVESLSVPLSSLVPSSAAPPSAPVDIREKTRLMIDDALSASQNHVKREPSHAADVLRSPTSVSALATAIELALFRSSRSKADPKAIRNLIFNLKNNPSLCVRVLRGEVTPAELIQFDIQQLASADVAAERDRMKQSNLDLSIFKPAARIASTDYKCPSCGSQECSTVVIREERDISKADTWGSKQGAGSVIDIRCDKCQNTWTKEE